MKIEKKIRHIPDFKNEKDLWVKSYCARVEGKYTSHVTLSAGRWEGVESRCKVGGSCQRLNPCYLGVENKFEDYQLFVDWSREQFGYNLKDENGRLWQLDKDFISGDSKIYSPDTCIFIPQYVNKLLVLTPRNDYPLGVDIHKGTEHRESIYRACCNIPREGLKHLGTYKEPMQAHAAWQKAKLQALRNEHNLWVGVHLKLASALEIRILQLESDLKENKETFKL